LELEKRMIEIDGIRYVPECSVSAKRKNNMKYVICRTQSAGVFAGYLQSREGQEAVLLEVRRIWSWAGAASLSQLAMEGTSKPDECKFPCEVSRIVLTRVIEMLDVTEKARKSIAEVAIWKN